MKYRKLVILLFSISTFAHSTLGYSKSLTEQKNTVTMGRATKSGRVEYAIEKVVYDKNVEPYIMVATPTLLYTLERSPHLPKPSSIDDEITLDIKEQFEEDDSFILSITNPSIPNSSSPQNYRDSSSSYIDITAIAEHVQMPSERYKNTPEVKEERKPPSKVEIYRSTTALPLFYERMGLDNETAPLPFTVMLFGNYMQSTIVTSNFQGNAVVQDVKFQLGSLPGLGINLGDFNMPLTGFAEVANVEQRFATGGVRFAVNVLPFWSVYGIFAYSSGYTKSAVNVKDIYMRDVDIKVNTGKPLVDNIANMIIQSMGDRQLVKKGSMPFVMDFDALSTGVGTSLAIGGKLFFTALDANYVITTVESANIMVHTVNASARFGMYKKHDGQQIAMWVGANYMENIAGSDKLGALLSVERLGDLFQLENLAQNLVGNKPATVRWSVDQRPLNLFYAVVGARYSPYKNFDIVTEIGFIDRLNIMVSAAYNF